MDTGLGKCSSIHRASEQHRGMSRQSVGAEYAETCAENYNRTPATELLDLKDGQTALFLLRNAFPILTSEFPLSKFASPHAISGEKKKAPRIVPEGLYVRCSVRLLLWAYRTDGTAIVPAVLNQLDIGLGRTGRYCLDYVSAAIDHISS